MGRRKIHRPLNILINNRLVGRLVKDSGGGISFQYDESWLNWPHHFPVSLSLSPRPSAYRGEAVVAVFENLLPDNPDVRRLVAEKTGAQGIDPYSLLEQIGRDCVGAMQFLPDDIAISALEPITGEIISNTDIETLLANLTRTPLGIDTDHEFRISVAGAQEKTALLFHEGQWKRPTGTTPTTHILKPQLGEIPTPWGLIDLSNSVENEHYCLKVLEGFSLQVAQTEIARFGDRKALVVERFDRTWVNSDRLLRLPQEDFCQALSIPPARKYQNQGGPGIIDILKRLGGSDDPLRDQAAFLKSQIIFWLIGATDGHGKNFSLFLRPGGRFELTPFYDVLSAQPAFDAKRIPHNKYKLAMSVGDSRKYELLRIHGRHFVETAKQAGLGPTIIKQVIEDVQRDALPALERAINLMPSGFHIDIHESIRAATITRLHQLETADEAL
ncbi:type II toxin-antitoxin system HipA family toxin [Asticcacaulis tiandongensis]|uniref:type II toxin-antitoxin system HipA family toxin n=1 Tax=Asticcacaulis tiandongensis TaxID=2565365 RepID=UPI0011266F3E|nr:type II toxin-antitoxin system HipA family toxin [Asticcacaulis tiandongensis]